MSKIVRAGRKAGEEDFGGYRQIIRKEESGPLKEGDGQGKKERT
jgi:hypothetical protein